MKKLSLILLVSLISCNDEDFTSDLVLLAKNWQLSSVALDSNDVSSGWAGFTLNFTTSFDYGTTNSPYTEIWPVSGTWEFSTGSTRTIILNGSLRQIEVLDDNNLVLRFNVVSTNVPSGQYVFTMIN